MHRRGFLQLVGAGVAGVVALAKVPAALFSSPEPIRLFDGPLMFQGRRVVYDRDCQKNKIYFINPETLWINGGQGWERPFLN